jgi:hypothetical protein
VRQYQDPIDAIWIATAGKLGIEVRRGDGAYASYDGKGVLTIAQDAQLDADDSLAQMILHELCHALVSGPDAAQHVDWGLENVDRRDLVREHACHRLQAALCDRHGLRSLFAVTTEHRPYWDALPTDPLAGAADPAIELARAAYRGARSGRWGQVLDAALAATARIADVARPFVEPSSLWHGTLGAHRSGFRLHADSSKTCGGCAWCFLAGPGRLLPRCRQTRAGARSIATHIEPEERACERFEPRFDERECGRCGACCREGFDLVSLRPKEAFTKLHAELVSSDRHGLHVPRPGGRCVALEGDGTASAYRCRVYETRPRSCRDFEIAGDACLQARRRVTLSR